MNWETINGVTGIISAICAFVSLGFFSSHKTQPIQTNEKSLSASTLMAFLLACSGWALCCLSVLWVFEPYGGYATDREYQQFYGVILAFPAVVVFLYAIKILGLLEDKQPPKGDEQ